jgi:hypothetical protein
MHVDLVMYWICISHSAWHVNGCAERTMATLDEEVDCTLIKAGSYMWPYQNDVGWRQACSRC